MAELDNRAKPVMSLIYDLEGKVRYYQEEVKRWQKYAALAMVFGHKVALIIGSVVGLVVGVVGGHLVWK